MSHTAICWRRRRNNVINREARNIPVCVDEDFEVGVETEFDTNGVEFNANGNDPDEKYEVDAVCSSDINVDVVVADVIKSVDDTEDVDDIPDEFDDFDYDCDYDENWMVSGKNAFHSMPTAFISAERHVYKLLWLPLTPPS